jgi:hypothetical protein
MWFRSYGQWHQKRHARLERGERTVDFVMLPAQALSDADPPPLCLRQETENARIIWIEIGLGNHFEQRLWEDDVPVFELVVGIAIRIMDASKATNEDNSIGREDDKPTLLYIL